MDLQNPDRSEITRRTSELQSERMAGSVTAEEYKTSAYFTESNKSGSKLGDQTATKASRGYDWFIRLEADIATLVFEYVLFHDRPDDTLSFKNKSRQLNGDPVTLT